VKHTTCAILLTIGITESIILYYDAKDHLLYHKNYTIYSHDIIWYDVYIMFGSENNME